MVFIKKLVMYGFKSFPRKTELPFTPGINVILGPNGSGKSNISDALCFVLGRLSIKSMRAAKARNLIFLGTKSASPAKEAMVEIVFDNLDNGFLVDKKEISIKRIVRRNGQSIYKINSETKTRQEVLTLLAQAGIDPNGFNIILQGEIQNFVKMHTEERRKIIEEVAGISIYESRKQKSLKELEKTENRLKEVLAILRERTSYLNNLEKERQQALKFKRLEKDIKIYKASIIHFNLTKNKKELEKIEFEIDKKEKQTEKIKLNILNIKVIIKNFESKINSINSKIQESTGIEQEKLNQEIADLRAELAGLNVKFENSEHKVSTLLKQKSELEETIKSAELVIKELKSKVTPGKNVFKQKEKQKKLEAKKQELEKLEQQRKRFYTIKTELKSIKERISDKNSIFQNYVSESDFLLKQINSLSKGLFDKNINPNKLDELKISLTEKKELLENLNKTEIELQKISYTNEFEIDKQKKLIEKISKIDICPLCKSKITKEHLSSIKDEVLPKISSLKKQIQDSDKELGEIYNKKKIISQGIEQINSEISKRESDMIKISNINEKKNQIKSLQEKIEDSKGELFELEKIKKSLEKNFDLNSNIEQKCETARIELEEISITNEENVDSEISFKQREVERSKISLNQLLREQEDLNEETKSLKKILSEKQEVLEKKKKKEEELNNRFQKLVLEKEFLHKKIRDNEIEISSKQNQTQNIEQETNNLKIEKAKFNAIIENLETDLFEFENIPIIKTNVDSLTQKLNNAQEIILKIGSVNLRSLEVYDTIKKEYDAVNEKVEIISKEKQGIFKIIHEIDIKKKRAFLKTLKELNEVFSKNFSQLSTKGQVFLELENRKEPFEAGVNIIVKTGHGKYFDCTSLSGGEQVLVALSLIFAIQELNPYCFYILDEIDAALDKRNSERLAGLLQRYMKKGQYIVITHNDEVISNATNLYGVSMHDGISKIISLKI